MRKTEVGGADDERIEPFPVELKVEPFGLDIGPNLAADNFGPPRVPAVATGSFGWAMQQIAEGKAVRRSSWDGEPANAWHRIFISVEQVYARPDYERTLASRNADSGEVYDWVVQESDVMATDWELFDATDAVPVVPMK